MNSNTDVFMPLWLKYAPMWYWGAVYLFTCLVGAQLILWEHQSFTSMYQYFSGVQLDIPKEGSVLVISQILLLLTPVTFLLGYILGWHLSGLDSKPLLPQNTSHFVSMRIMALAIFALSLSMAVWSVSRGGALENLASWSSHDDVVKARWILFDKLTFFEYVNAYLLLPVSAGWAILEKSKSKYRSVLVNCLVLFATISIALLLFQKKSLIVSLLLIFSAWALYKSSDRYLIKKIPWILCGAFSVLLIVYFAMVVVPSYIQLSQERDPITSTDQDSGGRYKQLEQLREKFGGFASDDSEVLFYSMLAPLTRTSVPAIYYAIVFPEKEPFYGLDLPFNRFTPDDNKVVWRYMYPNNPGGTVSAPFQFEIYSQVGLVGAILTSLITGIMIGASWRFVLTWKDAVIRSLVGSLLLLFSIYIAIDSIRNSVIVSYGVIWGVLFVIGVVVPIRSYRSKMTK